MTLIVLRFILVLAVLATIVIGIIVITKGLSNTKPIKVVHNYQRRFDPENNKYYIVNDLGTKEVPICTWYGRRIMYKDMAQVQYILDKLNDVPEEVE